MKMIICLLVREEVVKRGKGEWRGEKRERNAKILLLMIMMIIYAPGFIQLNKPPTYSS